MKRLWIALVLAAACSHPQPKFGAPIAVPCNQTLTPYGTHIDFPGRPHDVALDGNVLAVLAHREIVLLDATTGAIIRRMVTIGPQGFSFCGIAFHKGKIYASNLSGRIDVLEKKEEGWLFTTPIKLTEKPSGPGGLAFVGDTLYVAMNTKNELWEIVDGRVARKFKVGFAPYAVVIENGVAYVSNWGGGNKIDGRGVSSEGSVSIIELATGKTEEIVVGPHASGLAIRNGRLYVACANADRVYVIENRRVVEQIDVRPHASLLFGSSPNALAMSDRHLFVSNGTNNAVAIVDLATSKVLGHIPVGWYPAGILWDGKRVIVANVKGIGSRDKRREKGWNSHDYRGSVSWFEVPERFAPFTEQVLENNRVEKHTPAWDLPFEHVVYIIKENRTYDQILGDMPEGDGDPKLCEFGEEITPNHHALAREFVLLDRMFCSGVLSADGHQWTNEAFVTDYIEKFFGGWIRSYPYAGGDPMAYAPTGFLWDNALEHGKSLRVYGEFVGATIRFKDGTKRDPTYEDFLKDPDRIEIKATARVKTLEPHICPTAIGFPLTIPDQHRADQFLKELETRGLSNLTIMLLPADHTVGTKPGMPTPRACMADNDLALGRIVEAITKSKYWPKTCIFVIEDDPQAGFDHVDGRRTVGFVISPYTKRRAVVSTDYNQTSIVRTIELMLGLPPMNQFDASATPMRDVFTDTPDLTPYQCRPARVAIDERNAKLDDITDPDQRKWALASMELPLDDIDEADEDTLNRIVWHAMKGWRTPYPEK